MKSVTIKNLLADMFDQLACMSFHISPFYMLVMLKQPFLPQILDRR